jgi:hypothetical protein
MLHCLRYCLGLLYTLMIFIAALHVGQVSGSTS